MNLMTVVKGAVRVILVSRPDNRSIARGLILTLSKPGSPHTGNGSGRFTANRRGDSANGICAPGRSGLCDVSQSTERLAPELGVFTSVAQVLRAIHP
jgi:hypothetical protein